MSIYAGDPKDGESGRRQGNPDGGPYSSSDVQINHLKNVRQITNCLGKTVLPFFIL